MQCTVCFTDNPAGATLCQSCSTPLGTASSGVPGAAPAVPLANNSPSPTPPSSFAANSTPPAPLNTAAGASPQGTLVVEFAGRVALEVPLVKDKVRIGRTDIDPQGFPVIPDVDVTEADPDIVTSRSHAELRHDNQNWFLVDLGSSNGTFVEHSGKLAAHTPQPFPANTRALLGRGGPVVHWKR